MRNKCWLYDIVDMRDVALAQSHEGRVQQNNDCDYATWVQLLIALSTMSSYSHSASNVVRRKHDRATWSMILESWVSAQKLDKGVRLLTACGPFLGADFL